MEPTILPRDQHTVSRQQVSPEALKVLYRLKDRGYIAYLAGGCVRDLLLGGEPKDFDVVTDATPEQVRRCFRNCRLIGRRFRLAHVIFGQDFIEVATFRSNSKDEHEASEQSVVDEDSGVVRRDNVYGSPEEDAFRRDFTVNALFYNIEDFSIIDYVGALDDIEKKTIRCIGEPDVRYQEDPVRMLRAIRFAATLDLEIEDVAWQGILDNASHMAEASNARLFEELLKVFYSGKAERALTLLQDSGLLAVMLPRFSTWLNEEATDAEKHWISLALRQLDKWKSAGVKASSELIYGLLFAPLVRSDAAARVAEGEREIPALKEALFAYQSNLVETVLIPKRVTFHILDILANQHRFLDRSPAKSERLLQRPFFRDALVFFKFNNLATEAGHDDLILEWTEDLSHADPLPERGGGQRYNNKPRRRRRRR